jgi:periplasmic protein TonB
VIVIRTILLLLLATCWLLSVPITAVAQATAPAASQTHAVDPAVIAWARKVMVRLRAARVQPKTPAAGAVTVAFTTDRTGRVLSAEIAKSSGDPMLDSYATSLVRRASPLPPPPASVARDIMKFSLPFRFVGESFSVHTVQ